MATESTPLAEKVPVQYPAPPQYVQQQQYAQPQYQQPQCYSQQPAMGVPLYVDPSQQPTAVVIVQNESDDFVPACLGTACCGVFGLCGFFCFCNTPTGRVGASTGCIFYGAMALITYVTILILFKNDDCDDDSASGAICDTFFGDTSTRLIANVVIAGIIIIVAVSMRIKFVNELNAAPQTTTVVHQV